MHSGRRIASNYLWLPAGWLRRPLVEFDATGRVVRLTHLAGEADRSVATEFWAGVLILLPGGGTEVGADDGTWTLPLDPDRETLCELVRRRAAGQPIRLSAPATDVGTLRGVVGTLRRAQEATDAPLHEVIGWWAAGLWRRCAATGAEAAVGAGKAASLLCVPDAPGVEAKRAVVVAADSEGMTSPAGVVCGMPRCGVADGACGVPVWGAAARLVLLSGLDYERMRLTPQSELRLLV